MTKFREYEPFFYFNFRSYFFSLYYAIAFCCFLLYLHRSRTTQRKTVIIFPSNFNNAEIEFRFSGLKHEVFHLHEPIKNFSVAQYYSTFFDNLFSCELDVIAMQTLWNFSSQALSPGQELDIQLLYYSGLHVMTFHP